MVLWLIPLIVIAIITGRYFYRPSWEYLRNREPDKMRWVGMYSPKDLPVVEDALDDIKNAFLLRNDDVFRLLPNDFLLDVYKSAYPHKGADTLEFENLALFLRQKGITEKTLVELTNPTVGDIINLCLTHHSTGTPKGAP